MNRHSLLASAGILPADQIVPGVVADTIAYNDQVPGLILRVCENVPKYVG